jgi:hypothetical protein
MIENPGIWPHSTTNLRFFNQQSTILKSGSGSQKIKSQTPASFRHATDARAAAAWRL